MRVVIIGAGGVGSAIADVLSREAKDVVAIDKDEEHVRAIRNSFDVQAVHGSGSNPAILRAAGIEKADFVAAVTDSDEVNLAAAALARYLSPGATIVARIRSFDLAREVDFLHKGAPGIDHVINPEYRAARQIVRAISIPHATDVLEFEEGRVLVVGIHVPPASPLDGLTFMDIPDAMAGTRLLVIARYRDDELLIPRGRSDLASGDLIYFIAQPQEIRSIVEAIGLDWYEVREVVIAGATNMGLHLAAELEKNKGYRVKLIERDRKRADEAAERLERTVVLCGDPLDARLLEEENVPSADVLAAVCSEIETNLMVALLARRMGVKRTVVSTDRTHQIPILMATGIDTVVSPRVAAINSILHLVRTDRVLQASETGREDAEMIEYQVHAGDRVAGKALATVRFPKEALVGAIIRADRVIIPRGETELLGGDKILVVALKNAVPDLERFMKS
ncbi:MAG: Trk system potassium transporter TrkA [Deltaproteobacteria bacterium]|nr:Trk system potassium transporter TrkA [Deltaproteobacteria bacterium]